MDLQYITDTKGHKNGVLLSFNDWKKIQKNLLQKMKYRLRMNRGLSRSLRVKRAAFRREKLS